MGLLTVGRPLTWEEMKPWQEHVRRFGNNDDDYDKHHDYVDDDDAMIMMISGSHVQ